MQCGDTGRERRMGNDVCGEKVRKCRRGGGRERKNGMNEGGVSDHRERPPQNTAKCVCACVSILQSV